jgi:hypothetical protein
VTTKTRSFSTRTSQETRKRNSEGRISVIPQFATSHTTRPKLRTLPHPRPHPRSVGSCAETDPLRAPTSCLPQTAMTSGSSKTLQISKDCTPGQSGSGEPTKSREDLKNVPACPKEEQHEGSRGNLEPAVQTNLQPQEHYSISTSPKNSNPITQGQLKHPKILRNPYLH